MRPRTLAEVVGQEHLMQVGSPLARLIAREKGAPPSLILFGPPGSGKTTLALLLADGRRFRQLSAVSAGIKDVREEIDGARFQLSHRGTETVLFIDEVGTPKRPFDRAGLKEKFMLNTKRFPQAQMERMFERLQNIETEPNLDWLTA